MAAELKETMVSARLSKALVARLDFAARNTETEGVKNRSTAVQAAVETWLAAQEARFRELGLLAPKK